GRREFGFEDARLPELLFRYRARNWPDSLDSAESARWDDFRRRRLAADSGLSDVSLPGFFLALDVLRGVHAADGRRLALLDRLEAWGRELQAALDEPVPATGDPGAPTSATRPTGSCARWRATTSASGSTPTSPTTRCTCASPSSACRRTCSRTLPRSACTTAPTPRTSAARCSGSTATRASRATRRPTRAGRA